MKKITALVLVFAIALVLVACGDNASTKEEKSKEKKVEKDFEGEYSDMGAGEIVISTPSGTSEDGNVPVLFTAKDDLLIDIGLDTYEFDGSKLSYVYVDGMENDKNQFAETQATIGLMKADLKPVKHKVEVVQYDNDKPDGNVVTYKVAYYEAKEK